MSKALEPEVAVSNILMICLIEVCLIEELLALIIY